MHSTDFSRLRRPTCLLLAVLFTGPVACDPGVSRVEVLSLEADVEKAQTRKAELERELKELLAEQKSLNEFGGTAHQKHLQLAMVLRKEKDELEAIKKDLDSRVERFSADARRHRQTVAAQKP